MCRIGLSGCDWRRDLPDPRDLSPQDPTARKLFATADSTPRHTRKSLKGYFGPPRACPHLPSPAAACVDVVEYFRRRAFGRMESLSPLFLHQCAARLQGTPIETGVDYRSVLKALTRFGLPPERLWPSDLAHQSQTPDAITHGFAERFEGLIYLRLDAANSSGRDTLRLVKMCLSQEIPVLFGVSIPSSLSELPDIEYRPTFDSFAQGHALIAVGYDDQRRHAAKGALQVRSQWGDQWGDNGHGWLPYQYVIDQLAVDFWVLARSEWLEEIWA